MRRYPTVEQLLDAATADAGLDDFGPGDFRDGLEHLLDSLEHDGDLHPETDEAVIGDLRRRLVNRLEVEAWYVEHPEIDDVAIAGPVDVCGLPRTGTTALGDMLSLDPRFRCLTGWEQTRPVPPPVAGEEADDERRQAYVVRSENQSAEQRAMHIFEVDSATEDTEILGMAFHGQQMTLPVAGYRAWWRQCDLTETYRYHRRVVKLLGSRKGPERWLFKAPHHKFHLEALVAAYPDARFVMTHRDPAKVVPSYTSLVSTVFPAPEGERDLEALGTEVSVHLREGMERAIAERARVGEERFLDVHHLDLVRDPQGTIRRIYDWLGHELTEEIADTVFAWQRANAKGSGGIHHYTAEQFGLDAERIRSEYDFYMRRFDVAPED